ncbi:hypothetical protein J3R03_007534 [Actinoplanes couchii]|uniref:Uncharacterized protein n=2 Tax=Actinoplanes couchii TaxID=403638 RepID=A0ABQ3XBI3_9ACTN|nr:hypothetical protein [Actinoplanes couchii]MDR6323338.1 hypothetical protein [Actinoplanes couchii]GID55851.1 hypothetical protein Aco03nite_042550 [Actinoplanes couchii]
MATIEVDEYTKQAVVFAARVANLPEGAVIRRLIADLTAPEQTPPPPATEIADGIPIHADYEGHRVRARYIAPARVEIVDGPLAGQSYRSPTGAARAVVRLYNPDINDNRNGWTFWQVDSGSGSRAPLQSIRPGTIRSGRGSLQGRAVIADDWDSPETNDSIAQDFGVAP